MIDTIKVNAPASWAVVISGTVPVAFDTHDEEMRKHIDNWFQRLKSIFPGILTFIRHDKTEHVGRFVFSEESGPVDCMLLTYHFEVRGDRQVQSFGLRESEALVILDALDAFSPDSAEADRTRWALIPKIRALLSSR